MAGCVPCFVIPLLLFIFHRYIQPVLLKIWNPWEKLPENKAKFSCNCDGKEECTKEDKNGEVKQLKEEKVD